MKLSQHKHFAQNILILSGFGRPFGLNQDKQGNYYICDMDLHTVFKLDKDWKSISSFDGLNWSSPENISTGLQHKAKAWLPGQLNGPHAIEFDRDDNLYITCYYEPGIQVFDPQGKFIRTIGGANSKRPLRGPASSFFDKDKRLLVAEYSDSAILAYSSEALYLGRVDSIEDKLDRPHMIKQASDGRLFCADTWNHRILIFTPTGKQLHSFSHKLLSHPVSLCFMPNSDIIVSSWGKNLILLFSQQGEFKSAFRHLNLNKAYDAQYFEPWLVIADSHNGRLVFIDLKNQKL